MILIRILQQEQHSPKTDLKKKNAVNSSKIGQPIRINAASPNILSCWFTVLNFIKTSFQSLLELFLLCRYIPLSAKIIQCVQTQSSFDILSFYSSPVFYLFFLSTAANLLTLLLTFIILPETSQQILIGFLTHIIFFKNGM